MVSASGMKDMREWNQCQLYIEMILVRKMQGRA
jgi:hypothetical protein